MTTRTTATVRMYRLSELGDCFLLTFKTGDATSRMLIDCGSFRNGKDSIAMLRRVVADIAGELQGEPLDIVVGTHQHNDHLSGFVHCEDAFRKIGIGQVWLPWLDNPADRKATDIGAAHSKLTKSLVQVRDKLRASGPSARGLRSLTTLDGVLGFLGATQVGVPELPARAVEFLQGVGRTKPEYLRPGRILDLPGLPKDTVRAYVLGPPRDTESLYRKDPRAGESYDHALAAAADSASLLFSAAATRAGSHKDDTPHYPFGDAYKRRNATSRSAALKRLAAHYGNTHEAWRRIDDDWLDQAETLAIYLDTFTNNSSLVLAIELVASGKVLLFAADAQTGNWISWDKVKWQDSKTRTDDILARTVLYKVGHHGSHNATLADVLDNKLTHPDLMALIPVDKNDPNINRKNGWKMPAPNLFRRLREKTSNRVLRMDGDHAAGCDPRKEPARSAWARAGVKPRITEMYMELSISDN